MVLGAYTILNTVGLLVGLPLQLTPTKNDFSVDINNSLSFLTSNNWSNYYIIVDTENAELFSSQFTFNQHVIINQSNGSFDYCYNSRVGNYLIFTTDAFDPEILPNYNVRIDFSSDISFATNHLIINQIYYGVRTESLTPIGGDSVIGSISSGLGLIDDITKQFGNGFASLIWDSSKNQLTTFSNFALIFLGVSITFSIVKLCMALIRLKTGS